MTEPNNFYPSNIVLCVVKVPLCLSAIMLNSISIHAIRKTSSLQKTMKIMLLILAVSDLGVGLLVCPLAIVITTLEMTSNTQNNPAYKVIFTLFQVPLNLFYYATFFGVTALSVERFLAIFFHLRYQELVTYKRVVAAVISIWISCAFLSCIKFWTVPLIHNVVYVTINHSTPLLQNLPSCTTPHKRDWIPSGRDSWRGHHKDNSAIQVCHRNILHIPRFSCLLPAT